MKGSRADVAIVGGGVIGCALARELAGRGAAVTVIERGQPGGEASGAAAGLLAPQAENLEPGPLLDLALESRDLYPRWVGELAEETRMDVGYRRCGILRCALSGERGPFEAFEWQRRAGLRVEPCGSAEIASRSGGAVSGEIREGLFFPDEGYVNNRLLTRALRLSGERRGVVFLSETRALRVLEAGGRCAGVETDRGAVEADKVVNAAGAWAGFDPEFPVPVEPVRGQIVEIESPVPLSTVLESSDVYMVPRGGSLLLGSTAERAGFDKSVTAGAVERLLAAAERLVPSAAKAAFRGAWAGLRPGTPDGLPVLGRERLPGLFAAAGHFRNGILLAPVTSIVMADVLSGVASRDLSAFSGLRFGANSSRRLAGRA
ncbi:MAG TPA: glycine oxidase ThiO [Thermoanaerobaculia bacterium]|nr:glycine oxidase ThiO [Thermoanaerobaculia bacterium]